jgi:hypothetical protein
MALSIKGELRRTFEKASLLKEVGLVCRGKHADEYRELRSRCAHLREHIEATYRDQFDTRVEIARLRIIDQAGTPIRQLRPYGLGVDRFSKEATLRQAQRDVRREMQKRLDLIDDFEQRQLKEIVERASRASAVRLEAHLAFNEAASGIPPEHRQRTRRMN